MAILGRGRPNNAKIIWAGTFAIPEVTGDSAQTLDDYTMAASGTVGLTAQTGSPVGGKLPIWVHYNYRPPKPSKQPAPIELPVPIAPVIGSGTASLSPVSCTAQGFFDIAPIIEAEDELVLLLL